MRLFIKNLVYFIIGILFFLILIDFYYNDNIDIPRTFKMAFYGINNVIALGSPLPLKVLLTSSLETLLINILSLSLALILAFFLVLKMYKCSFLGYTLKLLSTIPEVVFLGLFIIMVKSISSLPTQKAISILLVLILMRIIGVFYSYMQDSLKQFMDTDFYYLMDARKIPKHRKIFYLFKNLSIDVVSSISYEIPFFFSYILALEYKLKFHSISYYFLSKLGGNVEEEGALMALTVMLIFTLFLLQLIAIAVSVLRDKREEY